MDDSIEARWTTRARNILWYASIDRRPSAIADVWTERARSLLAEKPAEVKPCFVTKELEALSGRVDENVVSECVVCYESTETDCVTVGDCSHAVCSKCSACLSRCPVCREASMPPKRFRFSMKRFAMEKSCI